MRLLNVRVQDFRCIEDSTNFSVAGVTCLVGKNESGKTALLKALHKLKPDEASKEQFVDSKDYPRRKWRPGSPIPPNPPAVTTTWELDDSDIEALEKQFGAGIISDRTFTLSKGYDNTRHYSIKMDEAAAVKSLIAGVKLAGDELTISESKTPKALQQSLAELKELSTAQQKLLETVQQRFPEGVEKAVTKTVAERIPTFLYFDEYLTLPGTVSVNDITTRKAQNQLNERDRVFLALLSLAGTTLEKVHGAGTFEEFNASLRAVSNQITDQIFKYWSQNKHLDVDIRLDHSRASDPPPFNAGWIFRTRIDNRRHRADTSFDDRSRGFVWFFSFLVWFYQLQQLYGKNLLILLDEPALSLHARAQADLLRYINEQLRPHYQVIYTTHSPFMIDAGNLLSARTVEDVVEKDPSTGEEKLFGTKVSEDVLSTDPDTVSPLQRVLDYELTQTLFIGKHTLLVEGASDLLYLKWFSRQLVLAGKKGLDYRWNICVVRGVDRIPGFVSLFRGNGLHIAAVVDVQHGHKAKIENARKVLADKHLLTLDTYSQQKEADIEDVLGRAFYVSLVNKALDLRGALEIAGTKAATAPERVVKEVEAHCATLPVHYPAFDHFMPAEWLFQHDNDGASLPGFADALSRVEKLNSDLNALMA
jgi:predicted ATP-dependent endonuclease of OLD family